MTSRSEQEKKRLSDAYEVVRKPIKGTPDAKTMAARLRARHIVLETGMLEAGPIARHVEMAETLADICLGLAIRLERAG